MPWRRSWRGLICQPWLSYWQRWCPTTVRLASCWPGPTRQRSSGNANGTRRNWNGYGAATRPGRGRCNPAVPMPRTRATRTAARRPVRHASSLNGFTSVTGCAVVAGRPTSPPREPRQSSRPMARRGVSICRDQRWDTGPAAGARGGHGRARLRLDAPLNACPSGRQERAQGVSEATGGSRGAPTGSGAARTQGHDSDLPSPFARRRKGDDYRHPYGCQRVPGTCTLQGGPRGSRYARSKGEPRGSHQ